MTGTDLVYSSASLQDRKQYATALAAAGSLLPAGLMENGQPSPGKILLVAETGNMLGIAPVAAIMGVNIIQGKPSIAPALMSGLVRQRGHKLRVKVNGTVGSGDLAVTVTLIRADDPEAPFEVTWTIQDAIDAGLVDSYALNAQTKRWAIKAKGSWATYPRQMLLHRATAEVCRQGANEVVMGVYTPEELGGHVNSEGELLDVTSTAVDRTRYEQDHDGPGVSAAMRENPESEPETGIMKEPKARLRDPAATGPDADATGPADTRPRSSRTKAEPGAGRTDADLNRDKAPKTSEDDRRHIADEWADRARKALTVTDARDLYRDANHRGILGYALTDGQLLGDVLRARGEHLADEEAHAAEADVPLEIPGDDVPETLPW